MRPLASMLEAAPDAAVHTTSSAVLERVRAHARLQTAWMERLWSEQQTSAGQGLAITAGEVHRLLAGTAQQALHSQSFLSEPAPRALLRAASHADAALAERPFWQHLARVFDLSPHELDLLTLVLAAELDPHLTRVFAYLADDTHASAPTLALAAALFAWPLDTQATTSNIERWHLAHTLAGEPAWRALSAWQAGHALVRSLQQERWTDPPLEGWSTFIPPEETEPRPVLFPEALTHLLALARQSASSPHPLELALLGPSGSGRRTLAAQLAQSLGRPLLAVDPPSPATLTPEDLIRPVRAARATGALLYWRHAESIAAPLWAELRMLAGLILTGARTAPPTSSAIALPPLTTARRLQLWSHLTQEPAPALLHTQRLTPAQIVRAAQSPDRAASPTLPRSSDLLNILPCPYTWDDLVLAPSLHHTLHDLEAQVRLRWQVYEDWGFARLTPLGQGISALFAGPSGTGKTMAAQVLARSLGLTLFRVDLAGVVNKYIGETEKRLREIFDTCEQAGGLLFFDEADALFGRRTQVKDAHDRFANIEIDYLLQRLEQFDGVALLATNRRDDLDPAFLRRLRFVVDFLPPGRPERCALWHKALPAHSPAGEPLLAGVNLQALADHLDLNGAQIKNIALAAAFLARDEAGPITMRHLELASTRELAKQGLRLRQPFAAGPAL